MVVRLDLVTRNSAGLNKLDSRLMHIMPEKPMQIAPSRYNVRTKTGTAKLTLNENSLDVVHLKKGNDGLEETANIRFFGDEKYLAERLVDMYNAVKFW